jgi:hypothetical protein
MYFEGYLLQQMLFPRPGWNLVNFFNLLQTNAFFVVWLCAIKCSLCLISKMNFETEFMISLWPGQGWEWMWLSESDWWVKDWIGIMMKMSENRKEQQQRLFSLWLIQLTHGQMTQMKILMFYTQPPELFFLLVLTNIIVYQHWLHLANAREKF